MLILLASWPKSGNTWLRSLLTCYIKDQKVPLNEMANTIPIDASKGLWEKFADLKDLEAEEVFPSRQEFYQRLAKSVGDKRLYLKTHSANLNYKGQPQFDLDSIDKIIHIVRNPFDVLPSFAKHMGFSIEDAWEKSKNDALALNGNEKQYRELLSSWELHTKSFLSLNHDKEKYLFVRYEDLKMKPFSSLEKIVRHVGLDVSEERLVNSVYYSSFKNRKEEEEKLEDGFKEAPRDEKFFRKGKVGSFREEIPQEILDQMYEKYELFCGQLGYKIK